MKDGSFGIRGVATVLVLAMAPAAAMAYIDPGNGAYMVQALFALAGAVIFYLRHPIRFLKAGWHSLSSRRKRDGMPLRDAQSDPQGPETSSGVTGTITSSEEL